MDAQVTASQPRRYFRFSLGMLLALVACICFFLGGNILGQRQATRALMRKFPTSSKTYYVEDLVLDAKPGAGPAGPGGGVQADFDSLMTKIQQQCAPETWEGTGGPSRISPFPLNLSLIVGANDLVHREVEELLTKLRVEKFGPDYEFQNVSQVGFVQAATAPVASTVSKTYFVSDLVGENAPDEVQESGTTDAHGIANLIKKMISPGIWGPGGNSTINASPSDARLHVDTTPIVHQAVADLLAQLRKEKLRREEEAAAAAADEPPVFK